MDTTDILWRVGSSLLEALVPTAEASDSTVEDILVPVRTGLTNFGDYAWTDSAGRGWTGSNRLTDIYQCQITITTQGSQGVSSGSTTRTTLFLPDLADIKTTDLVFDPDRSSYEIPLHSRLESTTLYVSDQGTAEKIAQTLYAAAIHCQNLVDEGSVLEPVRPEPVRPEPDPPEPVQPEPPTTGPVIGSSATIGDPPLPDATLVPEPPPPAEPPQCPSTFFYTHDPKIPAEYKSAFKTLATRAGSPTAVDSCDMDSFYEEMGIGQGQRKTNPQDFIEEKFSWWDEWEYINVFDYEAFYNHLTESVRNRFFPKVVDVAKDFRDRGEDIAKQTQALKAGYKELAKDPAFKGLSEEVASEFTDTYPYLVFFPPNSVHGYKPEIWSTGSVDDENIVAGAGVMVVSQKNTHKLSLPFDGDEEDLFTEVRAKQYDPSGEVGWYVNIEREVLWDAIPEAQLTGQGLAKVLAQQETPVETNMTAKQWQQFQSAEGLDGFVSITSGMEEAVPDDAAVQALVRQRIAAQIKEDDELWGWVRGIKHWWNSWEWWWNN